MMKLDRSKGFSRGVLLVSVLGLAACGSDDDTAASSTTVDTTYSGSTAGVALSGSVAQDLDVIDASANTNIGEALAVTSEALDMSTSLSYKTTTSTPFSAIPVQDSVTGKVIQLADNLMKLSAAQADSTALAGLVWTSAPQPCAISGSATFTINDYDGDSQTVHMGDSIAVSFSNCVSANNETINGSLSMAFSAYSLDVNGFGTLGLAMEADTLAVNPGDGSGNTVLHGDIGLSMSVLDTNADLALDEVGATMTGSSLYMRDSTGEALLESYSFVETIFVGADLVFEVDHDYTLSSTAIGGKITVTTVTPLSMTLGLTDYPDSGVMTIEGANGAKIRLTAQSDGVNILVEYDIVPVDGYYESSNTVTWAELEQV